MQICYLLPLLTHLFYYVVGRIYNGGNKLLDKRQNLGESSIS